MTSPGASFIFPIFLFSILLVGKRAKKKKKKRLKITKFCPSHSISQEPYVIWLCVLVHMCKMMISPAIISGFYGGKMAKNDPKLPM